jgi:DNA-binding transcriptional LysR family regulator
MELHMLSGEELELLEAIQAAGSLSRAAARLGKAPSTVSYAARQLETRFDALLFDRRRYRLQLTPAGQLLAREASRLALDVSRLTQRVKAVAGGWEDRLWIVTDEIMEFESLVPVIQDFDALRCGVALRITHEILGGTWDALRDGRADLVIGATNEPPVIANLKWFELGAMEWVFAVSPSHPLARQRGVLDSAVLVQHRSVVVADSSRRNDLRSYGLLAGQPSIAVPSMRAKIHAQRRGLGVGWLPRDRVTHLLRNGDLVEKEVTEQREPNQLFVAWRSDHEGRALDWWLTKLRTKRLARLLVHGNVKAD